MTKTLATRAIVVVVCVAAIVVGATYMSTGTPSINSHAGPSVAGGLLREGSTTTMETGMATGTEHGSSSQTKIKTSSTSLVGSGTAASDLKTLTIVVDDDELIDGLLSVKPKGGSSAYCKKNTGYNCGAVFPPGGNTCGQKGCCCNQEDGEGLKLNSCDSAKGYAYRGCNSCWGKDACFKTNNINAGTSSCHGHGSCNHASDSTIHNESCQGFFACTSLKSSTIHDGSCRCGDGDGYGHCCEDVKNSIIGKGSCSDGRATCLAVKNSIIGTGSCNYWQSCDALENIKIGNNSCNGHTVYNAGGVCKECKHDVPDNACNWGITDDMDSNGYCNYCK